VSITEILGKPKVAAAVEYFFRAGFRHHKKEKCAVFHNQIGRDGYRRATGPGPK